MPETFNDLLKASGLNPTDVRLLRHQTRRGLRGQSVATLWRNDPTGFELYQRTQQPNRPVFRTGRIWASFVSPSRYETLFVGMYDAQFEETKAAEWDCPYRGGRPGGGAPVDVFTTALRPELSEHIGKLRVSWDMASVRSWARYAEGYRLPLAAPVGNEADVNRALVSRLEGLGFRTSHLTQKLRQLSRGRLTVYVKRETARQPLILHPRYFDLAADFERIEIGFDRPLRPYINSNLGEYPLHVSENRTTRSRIGFAVDVPDHALPRLVDILDANAVVRGEWGEITVVGNAADPTTEGERLQAARVGQGDFRTALIAMWGATCPVAGVDQLELLRASHIKPWSHASDAERLDPFNGLLLCAHVDALFDRGLVSFNDDGRLLSSCELLPHTLQRLGVDARTQIKGLSNLHRQYLAYHRQHVFRAPSKAATVEARL